MTLTTQFHTFLSDPLLARAVELVRKVDDVFDLINPNENQHSRILQWLFDPREGHGQGEAIFKDFLNAVYEVNLGTSSRQLLFKNWNPGRIAISGFQSLIIVREKAILGAGRQDLLIVDPVHKFVILVENKSGSKWSPVQLAGYRKSLLALTKSGQPYYGFKTGFVLLDKFKDESAEEIRLGGTSAKQDQEILQWCHVNYTWLEKAARRAEVRAARNGDVGHQLVISYCRRQAEYESEDEKALDSMLANINQAHREVVQEISIARKIHRPTQAQLKLKDIKSLIWVWAHQNRDLATMLEHQKPLAFLASGLNKTFENSIEQDVGKKVMYVIDKSWDSLREASSIYWPLTVKVRDTTTDDGDGVKKRKYSVVVEFWPIRVQDDMLPMVKTALKNLFGKEVDRFATANVRRIGRKSDVPEERLQNEVEKMVRLLQDGLRSITESK